MSDHPQTPTPEALDAFIIQLLAAGAVLSQMISHMMRSQANRPYDPDAVPVPEVAHTLIREVIQRPMRAFSPADLQRAAAMVEVATDELVDQILFVPVTSGEPELN